MTYINFYEIVVHGTRYCNKLHVSKYHLFLLQKWISYFILYSHIDIWIFKYSNQDERVDPEFYMDHVVMSWICTVCHLHDLSYEIYRLVGFYFFFQIMYIQPITEIFYIGLISQRLLMIYDTHCVWHLRWAFDSFCHCHYYLHWFIYLSRQYSIELALDISTSWMKIKCLVTKKDFKTTREFRFYKEISNPMKARYFFFLFRSRQMSYDYHC